MGVKAGLRVHGWLKPTLEIELVEGGDLLANTTYYICAFMKMAGVVYNAVAGPMSDLHEITTTDTHRSVRITHKTYRQIQAFADNGDGRTLVTSERHCLADGSPGLTTGSLGISYQDTIKIDTGSYAGSWLVDEWVNYNQYIIDTPYVDNVPVESYTDSEFYNMPRNIAGHSYMGVSCMNYHVRPQNPYITVNGQDVWYVGNNRFSDRAYQSIYKANPITFTTFTSQTCTGGNAQVLQIDRGLYRPLKDYGSIWVVNETDNDLSDVWDEVMNSGFILNAWYNDKAGASYVKTFGIHGTIYNVAGMLTGKNCAITVIGGEIQNVSASGIWFDQSIVTADPPMLSAYFNLNIPGGAIYCSAPNNGLIGWYHGDNVMISGMVRLGTQYGDEAYQNYINRKNGSNVVHGVGINKIFKTNQDRQYMQISYDSFVFKNCTLPPIYHVMLNNASGNDPDIYMMENCYFPVVYNENSDDYHIRYYSYHPDSDFRLRYLNIDTAKENNRKQITRNRDCYGQYEFYRRFEFHIQSKGQPLEDCVISITDDHQNSYLATTGVDGNAEIDVLEQLTKFTPTDPRVIYWVPDYDTYYGNFTIKVAKPGYKTVELFIANGKGNEVQNIAIDEAPTLIQVDQETML